VTAPVAVADEPVQVISAAAIAPTVAVELEAGASRLVAGNLLVAVHQARSGTVSLPEGWTTAAVVSQEATTQLAFKQVGPDEQRAVVLECSLPTAQTLTVLELAATADELDWALDQVSIRRTGPDCAVTELSTGTTDLTTSFPQLAVAAFAFLGEPGEWTRDLTGGFVRRSEVASAGPAAERSAHATATRVLAAHAETVASSAWKTPRGAAALVATFRPVAAPFDPVVFARAGIPEPRAVRVVAQAARPEPLTLLVSRNRDLTGAIESEPVAPAAGDRIAKLSIAGLEPATEYHWGIRSCGTTSPRKGRVVTAPVEPSSFAFAVASCGGYRVDRRLSTHAVWDVLVAHCPDFFVHLGDLHYQDLQSEDVADHVQAQVDVFSSAKQERLWRRTPMAHMWSDHDFCGDNSFGGSRGCAAARAAYRRLTPQKLAWPCGPHPVSYSFSWGPRVRFLMPDCRSERSDPAAPDDASKTMLGTAGKEWLLRELSAAEGDPDVALVVLDTEVPWLSSDCDGDDWSVYATERAELAAYIEAHLTKALLALGGDAHMNAFDDGTNNAWGAFPVLQAGALDRRGSAKGGPYTTGTFPNSDSEDDVGQFVLVYVHDDGGRIELRLSARRVTTAGLETTQFEESIAFDAPRRR
jgi:PhoD-like phosphatase